MLHLRPFPDTREYYILLTEPAYDDYCKSDPLPRFVEFDDKKCGCGRFALIELHLEWGRGRQREWKSYCPFCFRKAYRLKQIEGEAEDNQKILAQMKTNLREIMKHGNCN